MSAPLPASVLDLQAEALLQRVSHYKQQRCAELRAAAEKQAREVLRGARTEALAKMRNAVASARARLEQEQRQRQAQAELEVRRRTQRGIQALLAQMWRDVATVLEAQWRDPVQRHAWAVAAFGEARALMSAQAWRIEHGPQWPDATERRDLEQCEPAKNMRGVQWQCDPTAGAGLRIRATGVCLDATIAGLLAQRDRVEAAFLAEYFAPLQ